MVCVYFIGCVRISECKTIRLRTVSVSLSVVSPAPRRLPGMELVFGYSLLCE